GYIDARPQCRQIDENLLRRTPFLCVREGEPASSGAAPPRWRTTRFQIREEELSEATACEAGGTASDQVRCTQISWRLGATAKSAELGQELPLSFKLRSLPSRSLHFLMAERQIDPGDTLAD